MSRWCACALALAAGLATITTVNGAEMIAIPAGILRMGSNDGEPAERPVHRVQVSRFLIDRHEITNTEFAAFVAATAYVTDVERGGAGWHWKNGRWKQIKGADWRHPYGPNSSIAERGAYPVVQVSWNDGRAYCAWTGKRLPSEAQWERAARGDGARRYAWGDAAPHEGNLYRASYGTDACCRTDRGDGYLYSAPVGSFAAGRTPLGVDDLTGNVWEWVEDAYDPGYYARAPKRDPVNRTPSGRRVIRGGGWGNNPWGMRATLRHANPPRFGLSMVGIRCARSPSPGP